MVFLPRSFTRRDRSSRTKRRQSDSRRKRSDLQFQTLESRQLLDGYGVRFAFFPDGGTGAEVSTLSVGQNYVMRTFVQDQRATSGANTPSGIRQAVFDITHDSSLLQFNGPITLGSEFQVVPGRPNSGVITPGRLDNLNGRDRVEPTGTARSDELLFFQINVTALAAGSVDLDVVPANEPNLRAEFYFPLGEVTEFDESNDQIQIVGSGVVFTSTNNLQVAEGDAGATFQATLSRQPASPVTFTITPPTAGRVTVSRPTVTFTRDNWNVSQTIQITAVQDLVDRGTTTVRLVTGNLQSSDLAFNNVSIDDIDVTVSDDDFAGITFNPSFGFITDENGRMTTTQVSLDSQPTSNVTVNFTSTDTTEGTISPGQLVFTPTNWNQSRTLTITGVDDDDIDGPQSYAIIGSIVSNDAQYQVVSVPTLSVSNADLDVADFFVDPNVGLITRETGLPGDSDTFNIRLRSRPASNVVFDIASSDTSEGVPSVNQVTFTPLNWNQAQQIVVNGVDDLIADGSIAYEITVTPNSTSDPAYRSLPAKSVMVTNQDNDVARLIVSLPNPTFTTEPAGSTTFTTRLQTPPIGTVTVAIASSDSSEGTVSPVPLTFTSANWDQPQTITVTGVDDVTLDGEIAYSINVTSTSTTDANYNNLSQVVSLTNRDNDLPNVNLVGAESLRTNENGGTDSFGISLAARPLANVTIRLTSSNLNEVNVSPSSLLFTPANWNVTQTVTLTGVNDNILDGDQTVNLTLDFSTSADVAYRNFTRAPLTVTNEGDQARLLVQPITGLITNERIGNEQSDSFSVRLTRRPDTNVVIDVLSSDIGEGVPDQNELVFTPQNFDQPQTVTVTGVNDDESDGDQAYEVTLTTTDQSDSAYRNLPVTTVMLTNRDDDIPALIVGAANPGTTTEAGGTSQIAVRLQTQPIGEVRVSAVSGDTSEGIISGNPLTFDATNWNSDQTITVIGQDDTVVDGNIVYQITLTPSSTTDANYNSASLSQTVSLSNTNDDLAELELRDADGLRTNESGLSDSFGIRLRRQPLNDVSVRLSSDNPNEVTLEPAVVNFTTLNWDQFQTVTLTGVDDGLIADGDQAVNIVFDLSQSADTAYASVVATPIVVTNADNDIPAVNVVAPNPIVVSETGATGTFTVRLATPPTQPVTIMAVSQDTTEATVSPATLTFTATNFDQPQTITVTGVDDQLVDEDVLFNITLNATSEDSVYNAIPITPVSVRNLNDDVGNVRVIAANDLRTDESGSTVTFDVVLTRQPTENVTVPVTVEDATELSIGTTNSLLFTPANWNLPQTVTATGLADGRVDADGLSRVLLGPTTSVDADFDALTVNPVSITNSNIDTATISVVGADVLEGAVGETRVMQFTIRLDGSIESGLSVTYAAVPATSGMAATAGVDFTAITDTIRFTGDDGETIQIEVPILGDGTVESHESIALRLSDLVGSGIDPLDINQPIDDAIARILNDDTATITIASSTNGTGVFEGDAGTRSTITANVVLSAPVQGGVMIDFQTSDNSAMIADNDYVANSGTISLGGTAPVTQIISVEIIGDNTPEPDETFNVSLSNLIASDDVIRDAITIVNSPLTLTIQNDDAPRLLLRNVTTDSSEGNPGDSRTFRFEIELTDRVDDADGFSIPIRTLDGSARSSSDFTPVDTILNFAGTAGETKTVDVIITGDHVVEIDEMFTIRLGSVSGLAEGAPLIVATPEVTATITNDDTASIRLVASRTSVTEGGAGTTSTITFTATLDGEFDGELNGELNGDFDSILEVQYAAVDATAMVADGDYVPNSGTLRFTGEPGQTLTFDVVVNGDSKLETNEMFLVGLSPSAGSLNPLASSVTLPANPIEITILADDRVTLSIQDSNAVTEGNVESASTELTFNVTLSAPVSQDFEIAFSTDTGNNSSGTNSIGTNTATAGVDFIATSGQLMFAADATITQTIRVPVRSDRTVELDETVAVVLGSITGLPAELLNFIDIDRSVAAGVIANDDTATITIEGPSEVTEPGGPGSMTTATYTVRLSAPVQGGFNLGYATTDDTASTGDFRAASGTLNFTEDGPLTQTFLIEVLGDSRIENAETFSVGLGDLTNLPPGLADSVTVSTQPLVTTILDDDTITVSFRNSTSDVAETNGTHLVEVVLTTTGGAILEEPLDVDVVVRSTSSAGPGDFVISITRIRFAAGSGNGSTESVRIDLTDDGQIEPTETIVLGLEPVGGAGGGAVGGAGGIVVNPSNHTVSVTDDSRDAVISGSVWADTNSNSIRESHELAIRGVTIELTGTSRQGESISMVTTTNANGVYVFEDLPAGTYTVTQIQPSSFHDGLAIAPRSSSTNTAAVVRTNQISAIQITPSQRIEDGDFTELGYRADAIPSNAFTARRPAVRTGSAGQLASPTSRTQTLDSLFANW